MAGQTIVTTARFVAEEVGVEKTAAALNKLQGSATQAGTATEGFSRRTAAALKQFAKARDEALAATPKLMTAGDEKAFAKVQQQNARALQIVQHEATKLQSSLDPAAAAAGKLAQVQAKLNALADAGAISWERHGQLVSAATDRWGKSAKTANDNVKLTTHQVTNLGYQINDIGTMLALGASPFQIMASQAGQVIQVLGDGPKGVKGSLAAIGSSIASLATRTNLIVGGLTAAGAAAIYFATRSDSSVKTAEEALKGYKALVDSLEDSYSLAGDAAERHFKRAQKEGPNVALAAIQGSQATLTESLQREMEGLFDKTQTLADRSIRTFADLTPEVLKGQDAIRKLGQQLNSGAITVGQFRDGIAQLRTDPTTAPAVKKIADSLLDGSVNAYSLANALGAVGEAAATASGKMGRLKVPSVQDMVAPYGGALDMMKRLKPEAFDGLVDGLRDQADALTETTEKTNAYSDAVAEQRQGIKDSLASLRLQVDMIGESDGAIAAAKMQMDALAEAQRQATDAGKGTIDPALVSFITQQAEEYGRLTDQVKANTEAQREQEKAASDVRRQQERVAEFASDLQFERSIAGLPEAEQRVRETIRGLDVDYDSFEGQRLAAGIRYNDSLVETQDRMKEMGEIGNEVFFNLIDAIGSGENAMGAFAKAFSGLGKQMASDGFDKLFGGLFGKGAAGGGGIAQSISSAVTQQTNYTAPLGKVTRTALPPIVTGDGFSASKAASVAGQSVPARMWNFFEGKGLASHQIAGILGQAKAESNFNPTAVGDNGQAFGLFQHNDRKYNLFNSIGGKQNLSNDVAQYEFVWKELQTTEKKHFDRLLAAKDYIEANDAMIGFERPAGYQNGVKNAHNYSGRLAATRDAYETYGQNVASSTNDTRGLAKGVSAGVVDAQRKLTSYDLGGYDAGGGGGGFLGAQISKPGTFLGMQHQGLTVGGGLGVAAGAFGGGYESGSPISGALSGAMAGLSSGNPAAAVVGAVAGNIGSPLARKERKTA